MPSDTTKKAPPRKPAAKKDEVNPQAFMAMMLSGAIMYAVRNWDDYRAQVAKVNGTEVTSKDDKVWADAKDALTELSTMLVLYSALTMDPDTGPEIGNALIKVLAAHV